MRDDMAQRHGLPPDLTRAAGTDRLVCRLSGMLSNCDSRKTKSAGR